MIRECPPPESARPNEKRYGKICLGYMSIGKNNAKNIHPAMTTPLAPGPSVAVVMLLGINPSSPTPL